MTMLSYLFWTVLSFFSGSVMYSYLIPKLLYKKDITQLSDDHNPGCGNVFTLIGIPCGILCLVLELAKGALPVWLALRYVSAKNMMFAGILAAPVLGHAFSPMLRNKGGKAIAVTFGVLIGLCSRSLLLFVLAAALVIFSTVLRITPHSMRVMVSYAVMLACAFFIESNIPVLFGTAIITVTVIYRHMKDYRQREHLQFDLYLFSIHLFGHDTVRQELSHKNNA